MMKRLIAVCLMIALLPLFISASAEPAAEWGIFDSILCLMGSDAVKNADRVLQRNLYTGMVNGMAFTVLEAGYDGRSLFLRYSYRIPEAKNAFGVSEDEVYGEYLPKGMRPDSYVEGLTEEGSAEMEARQIGWWYDQFWIDGKLLTVLAETNNWYRAQDPETLAVGYISKSFTRIQPRAAVQEPVSDGTEQLGTLNVNGQFDLTCKLPEGYTMQVINMRGSSIIAAILSDDMTKPGLSLTVAYDDTYSDVERMNDLSEEDLKALEETFTVQDEVEISYAETGHGTKLLIAKENDGDGDTDFVRILSVYKGYFIEFDMEASEDAAEQSLTDEQIRMCIDFLTNLDFNEVK